jgi:hypothetical protein
MSPKLMMALAKQFENERRRDWQQRQLLSQLIAERRRGTSANRPAIRLAQLMSGFRLAAARCRPTVARGSAPARGDVTASVAVTFRDSSMRSGSDSRSG